MEMKDKPTGDMEVPQGASQATDAAFPAIDINLSLPLVVSPEETVKRNSALWPALEGKTLSA